MDFLIKVYNNIPAFLLGFGLTIKLTFYASVFGFLSAIPLVLGILYGNKFFMGISKAIVTLIRGTPMLVQLFFIYYGLPPVLSSLSKSLFTCLSSTETTSFFYTTSQYLQQMWYPGITEVSKVIVRIQPITAAIFGFIINSAAYQAEYLKGGFLAISKEQMEAAYSIGLNKWQSIRYIIFPQAFRFAVPALSNEIIYLIQYTSVAYIIQVPEFFAQSKYFASNTYYFFEIFFLTGIFYLFFIFLFTKFSDYIEKKLYIPGFDVSHLK